jgi:hypothetical protein
MEDITHCIFNDTGTQKLGTCSVLAMTFLYMYVYVDPK